MQKNNPASKLIPLFIIFLLSLLTTGCDRGPKDNPQQAQQHRPVPVVSTITITTQKTELETELSGRTSVYKIAQIRPQVNGLIQKKLFTEGSDVKTGQILYQIDPALFQAVLDNALANLAAMQKSADLSKAALNTSMAAVTRQKATLALAVLTQKRFEKLITANAVSESERDQVVTAAEVADASLRAAEAQMDGSREAVAVAKATIHQAEAAVKIARINLGYCRVIAPIDGRIGRSNITEGGIVTAYQPVPLASIQQLDPIYVDVPQSTTELLRLRHLLTDGRLTLDENNPNTVSLILEDEMAYPIEGTLQFSDVTVDPTTGSVIMRLVFPNPDGLLLPGMFVRTIIKEGVNEQAILVPQQGVSRDHKGNPFALIVDAKNKTAFRPLTLERAMGDKWLVSAGLAPGDQLIVEGLLMLRPGTLVKATPFKETKTGQEPMTNQDASSKMRKDGGD